MARLAPVHAIRSATIRYANGEISSEQNRQYKKPSFPFSRKASIKLFCTILQAIFHHIVCYLFKECCQFQSSASNLYSPISNPSLQRQARLGAQLFRCAYGYEDMVLAAASPFRPVSQNQRRNKAADQACASNRSWRKFLKYFRIVLVDALNADP